MAELAGARVVRVDAELLAGGFPMSQAVDLLRRLVKAGAAIGWVEPPADTEVVDLLSRVVAESGSGDACLVAAFAFGKGAFGEGAGAWSAGAELAGLGYWRRYARPTLRVHADVEKVAVAPAYQGAGIGRRLMQELIAAAMRAGVEVLTLDLRGDNAPAAGLYESLGFVRYGRLERFVAVAEARYDQLCYSFDLRTRG